MIVIDGSGVSGQAGANGSSSSCIHAQVAQPGIHGRNLDITLCRYSSDGLRVHGMVDDGRVIQHFGTVQTSVKLLARGGDGGRGGNGANGRQGDAGRDGISATRHSRGTDGMRGGEGQDGGNGTSGANAGNGGRVNVRVQCDDADLLMLVDTDERAGQGGAAGCNGKGGHGGQGGKGGSSHSWTTHHRVSSYRTDNRGISRPHEKTVTRRHRKSGGDDGATGKSGRDGNARVLAGVNGLSGSHVFWIDNKAYAGRYDLRVEGFRIATAEDNGMVEPSQYVTVQHIQVANVGPMPLPYKQPVVLRVAPTLGIQLCSNSVASASYGLGPYEREQVDDTLAFQVDEWHVPASLSQLPRERFRIVRGIHVEAHLRHVGRKFENGTGIVAMAIEFPLEITPLECIDSLVPGEITRCKWLVRNLSSKPLGEDYGVIQQEGMPQRAPSGRRVQIRFALDEPSAALQPLDAACVFYNHDATQVVSDAPGGAAARVATLDVTELAPGKTQVMQLCVGFRDMMRLRGQQPVTFACDLYLENPSRTFIRPIQRRTTTLQLGDAECMLLGAQVLFVFHCGTSEAELEMWRTRATRLGLHDVSLLNLSVVGTFDAERVMKRFHGRTIVLFEGDKIHTPRGARLSHQFVHARQLVKCYLQAQPDARLLVVYKGADPSAIVSWVNSLRDAALVMPLHNELPSCDYANVDAFCNALRVSRPQQQQQQQQQQHSYTVSTVQVKSGGRVDDTYTQRWRDASNQIAQQLREQQPWKECIILTDQDQDQLVVIDTGKRRIGLAQSCMIVPSASDGDVRQLLAAIPFQTKLQILVKESHTPDTLYPLLCALQVDIAQEQLVLGERGWNHSVTGDCLSLHMEHLLAFAAVCTTVHTATVEAHLLNLVARVRLMSDAHVRWWEMTLPCRRTRQLRDVTRLHLSRILDSLARGAYVRQSGGAIAVSPTQRQLETHRNTHKSCLETFQHDLERQFDRWSPKAIVERAIIATHQLTPDPLPFVRSIQTHASLSSAYMAAQTETEQIFQSITAKRRSWIMRGETC
jgi:hypothetical protein